jgi:hypothetical protein
MSPYVSFSITFLFHSDAVLYIYDQFSRILLKKQNPYLGESTTFAVISTSNEQLSECWLQNTLLTVIRTMARKLLGRSDKIKYLRTTM